MPTGPAFAITFAFSAVAAAVAGRSERRRVWIAVGFSAFSASVWLVLLFVNMQPEPELGGWGLLTPFAFLYGALPALFTRPDVKEADVDYDTDPMSVSMDVARDFVFSPVICCLAVSSGISALIAAWAAISGGGFNGFAIGLGLVAVFAAEFAVVRISKNQRGMAVFGAIPGIPLYSIRADRIRAVEYARIRPLDWGGWGYRISGLGTGVILRAGPGLTIRSTSGRSFTVSVRHPERFGVSPQCPMNASSAS